MRSVGDEPACCGHARRLGERPIFGDPWPFGPASTGPGQTPPLGRASPQGSLSGGSSRVDAKIRSASSLNLFPTIKKKKKKKKKDPRTFDLWSFPSLMGFRRLSFPTDFIFLFPNHICLPALSKPYQRREISSWLARWFPKDPAKPVVAQKTPIRLELVAGKTYRWCVCGRSKNQPFCDGSHFFQRTGLSPLKFKAQETRTVALCTCKATQRPPYCDGTHKSEQVQKAEVGSPL